MRKNYLKPVAMRCWFTILSCALLGHTQAQQVPPGNKPMKADQLKSIAKAKAEKTSKKVPQDLLSLKEEYQTFVKAQAKAPAQRSKVGFKPSNDLLQVINGSYVVVDAVAAGDPQALAKDLKALGATRVTVFKKMVSAVVPIQAIEQMSALGSLSFARPAYQPYKNVGAVTSQGDKAQRSDIARANFKVNGAGTKVGILSDSYNALGGAPAGVLSGDLPGTGNPNGYTTPVEVLLDYPNGIDEGRGMAEIVHDVAPGAKQAFYSAFYGQADFAQGIIDLKKEAGCDIIVDDVIYYAEPFFQDGIVAQAVDSVKAMGVTYFSSAGNQGRASYESAFNTSVEMPDSNTLHEFAPGVPFQTIRVRPGAQFILDFQWSDPFGSLGGEGAKSDLDIFLLDRSFQVVASSTAPNEGGDPFEIFGGVNTGTDSLFYLVVNLYSGPVPAKIKYVIFGSATILDFRTNSPTLWGHANAAGAIATGAAFYFDTPAFGTNPPVKEGFSSAGGVPILFDTEGKAISPVVRMKPEVVGPDGGNSTFFPPFPGQDVEGDGFPNFFGTSASAPHLAAVAALMKQAAGKDLAPDKIKQVMQDNTVDMETPGFDFNTGYGLVEADKAVQSVLKQSIQYFVLFNSQTGALLDTIQNWEVINLNNLPAKVNIRAITAPVKVGSVLFDLNGKKAVENAATYDFAGTGGAINFAVGTYTLSATVYSGEKGTGTKGETLTINFKVVDEKVTSFVLFNSDNGKVLGTIKEGDVLNLAALPALLNIRAITSPAKVGSVLFDLNGKKVIENHATYDYAGTGGAVDLKVGNYTLMATVYNLEGAKGTKGGALTVHFKVVNNSIARMVASTESALSGGNQLVAAPNPFSTRVTIKFRLTETENANLSVYDSRGALIAPLHVGVAVGGQEYTYELDGTALQQGMYISRLITDKGVLNQKVILTK